MSDTQKPTEPETPPPFPSPFPAAFPATFPPGLIDSRLTETIKASAHQIWLAGMGAFAKAQEEGNKVFEALVQEGTTLQQKTQEAAEQRLQEVTQRVSAMAGEVSQKAENSWDKLESIFETRTAKAMTRLGMPSAAELAELRARVDELSAAVAALQGQGQPAPASAAAAEPTAVTGTAKARRVKRPGSAGSDGGEGAPD